VSCLCGNGEERTLENKTGSAEKRKRRKKEENHSKSYIIVKQINKYVYKDVLIRVQHMTVFIRMKVKGGDLKR
jgi:hypothetical protein